MNKLLSGALRRASLAFVLVLAFLASPTLASDPALDSLGSMAAASVSNTKGPLLVVFGVVLAVTVLFFGYRKIKGAAGGR